MGGTLQRALEFRGVGLHGGQRVRMGLEPAPPGSGIAVLRTDLGAAIGTIPARYDHVTDTRLCTRIGNAHGASAGTVEHVMAALAGSGVTDAVITLDGPEAPIMDGSARPFVAALARGGTRRYGGPERAIRIRRPVVVEDRGRRAALSPADRFSMSFTIAFPDPAIATQSLSLELTGDAVARQLADCRTFGMLSEVEALRRAGLARGGGLDNAIVVDRGRVLNPDGLRRADEFVRHKMLDAVGDLALAGAPILGHYEGHRAGHEISNRLLHALFAAPDAWEWTEVAADCLPQLAAPAVPVAAEARRLAV